jgi:predicted DNA-binding transcriptional regulator AlpA
MLDNSSFAHLAAGVAGAVGPNLDDSLAPQAMRATKAAKFCGLSVATWWRWDAAGKIPCGYKITGGTKLWRRQELEAWIAAGFPSRKDWEASRSAEAKRAGK